MARHPYQGNPLEVRKSLCVKRMTNEGAKLEPVTGTLKPGDEVVSRIEPRVGRAMEYIHLKNQRGSGVEPVKVLSQCEGPAFAARNGKSSGVCSKKIEQPAPPALGWWP